MDFRVFEHIAGVTHRLKLEFLYEMVVNAVRLAEPLFTRRNGNRQVNVLVVDNQRARQS